MEPDEKVANYIRDNVSPMLRTGDAHFDETSRYWHVPVLTDVGGRPVVLATYVLDRRLRFIRNPVQQLMDRLTEQLSAASNGLLGDTIDEGADEPAEEEPEPALLPLVEHAQEVSLVDQLTGLGTPAALLIRLEQEIDRVIRYESAFCLTFLDVEEMRSINQALGPLVADALIAQVGHVIQRVLRGGDFVARWSGARFVMLIQGPKDPVYVGAERILRAVRSFGPIAREGDPPIKIKASIGGISVPGPAGDAPLASPEVLREARGAVMTARASGKDVPFFV